LEAGRSTTRPVFSMDEPKQRGGPGRGQGRKALAGEVRKPRAVKMTDAEWDDFKLVTPEAVRQWVAKQAAKLRKTEAPTANTIERMRLGVEGTHTV